MKDFPAQYRLQDNDVLYFCHIPKTAGMTFRTIVEDYFDCHDICPATLTAQVATIPPDQLQTHILFRGHLGFVNLPGLLPNKRFVNVTVLRDPISRVISHYEYIRRTPGDPHYAAVKEMSLEDYTTKMVAGRLGKNIQTYYLAKLLKFDIERVPPDEAFAIAKESLEKCAFVGLLERFQDSLFLLSYIFGWKPIMNSRKENAAKNKTPREQLPASTLDVIRESSLLDLQIYEYAQAIFKERFDQMTQNLVNQYANPAIDPSHLTSDTVRELLERHYEHRYVEEHPTLDSAVNYSFCEPLKGTGWQRRECPPDGAAYRWMGPGTVSTLDIPVATDTDLIVEFRVICTWVATADMLDSLTLAVNGHPVPFTTLHSDLSERLFQAKVPQSILSQNSPFTELKFEVNRVISLKEANPQGNDARMVGLAFNYIHVFPAAQEQKYSALSQMLDSQPWAEVSSFIKNHLKPGERVLAPLAFRIAFPEQVEDYSNLRSSQAPCNWVVLHKGMTDNLSSILARLVLQNVVPVFANEVFVVFSNRRELPKLSYLSAHVRSLYVSRIKFYLEKRLKAIYARYATPKQILREQKERQALRERMKKTASSVEK